MNEKEIRALSGWVALVFLSNLAWQVRLFFALFPVLAILCAGGLTAVTSLDTSALRASVIVHAAVALILALGTINLGNLGDVVRVKDGYARNFLIPTDQARRATEKQPVTTCPLCWTIPVMR